MPWSFSKYYKNCIVCCFYVIDEWIVDYMHTQRLKPDQFVMNGLEQAPLSIWR